MLASVASEMSLLAFSLDESCVFFASAAASSSDPLVTSDCVVSCVSDCCGSVAPLSPSTCCCEICSDDGCVVSASAIAGAIEDEISDSPMTVARTAWRGFSTICGILSNKETMNWFGGDAQ